MKNMGVGGTRGFVVEVKVEGRRIRVLGDGVTALGPTRSPDEARREAGTLRIEGTFDTPGASARPSLCVAGGSIWVGGLLQPDRSLGHSASAVATGGHTDRRRRSSPSAHQRFERRVGNVQGEVAGNGLRVPVTERLKAIRDG